MSLSYIIIKCRTFHLISLDLISIFNSRYILWLTSSLRLLFIIIYYIYTCWRSFGLFNFQVTVSTTCYIHWICFVFSYIDKNGSLWIKLPYDTVVIRFMFFLKSISIYPFGIMEYYYLNTKILAFHPYWTYPWMI